METPLFRFKLDRDFQLTQQLLDGDDPSERRIADLDNGFRLLVPFRSTFTFDDPRAVVEIVLDVEDGRPAVAEYTVRRRPGGPPLEFVARDVMRSVSLRDLMAEAMAWQLVDAIGESEDWRPDSVYIPKLVGLLDTITSGTRSTRLPMSDERLRRTAEAFVSGGMDAVIDLEGWQCERRQAQRAVKLARERGFLPPSESS